MDEHFKMTKGEKNIEEGKNCRFTGSNVVDAKFLIRGVCVEQ